MKQRHITIFRNLTKHYRKMSFTTNDNQSTTKLELTRQKPFIVICGCTGTGKTKLSIQLAEWLVNSMGKRAEIINADAMQVVYLFRETF